MEQLTDFKLHEDHRGALVAIESERCVPFAIKRIYYIYNTDSEYSRGFHAHKQLEQMLICIKGTCRVLMDNGQEKWNVIVDNPAKGLLIPACVWHEMHDFSEDFVGIVLASDYYDETDYMRDYTEFYHYITQRK